jgi:hypothetical protein
MLLDAAEKFQLAKKVQQFLPDYSFNVSVHANNAVRVKNIRERFMKVLKSKENPDGFIIMTGSSISVYMYLYLPPLLSPFLSQTPF